jgi:glyoxylase-like metal-dependent hydrolase (beta-lactamase superfamily II)
MLPAGVMVFERGWLSSNNVLVLGQADAALVDSGYCTHADQTVELVRRGLEDRPLATLINTHLHSDHCGGNAAVQAAFPRVRTSVPPGHSDAVRRWDEEELSYAPTGQQCPRFSLDGVLFPGGSVRLGDLEWQVHAAPGHDQHSVILFEPRSRTLISADALWENGFGVVFQELEGDHAFDEVDATLDLISSLSPALVIPGHGSVFADASAAIERARSRLRSYVADPRRHAAHAAKVLLKFKLLELQRVPWADLVRWAEKSAYFDLVRARWFPQETAGPWLLRLMEDLIRGGAARRDGDFVVNS